MRPRSLRRNNLVLFTVGYFLWGLAIGSYAQAPADSMRTLMQLRASELKQLRQWLLDRQPDTMLQATPYYYSEGAPSEGDILSPFFYAMDTAFHQAYLAFYARPSAHTFNRMVQVCEACHQHYCPGPLRLIRRLYVPEADSLVNDSSEKSRAE